MRVAHIASEDDFDGWRTAARTLASAGVSADQVTWQVGDAPADLFGADIVLPDDGQAFAVPRAFIDLAQSVVAHSDTERFALLYRMLLRLREAPGLIHDPADPLVRKLEDMAKSVRRDVHKMRAFLRFREVETHEGPRFVAWFEPEHHIVRMNAGFFVRRFAAMSWSILTPELSLHWDGEALTEGPGAARTDAPAGDPVEEVWRTYYSSIFNPARLKIGAMLKEMPRRYWKNMPETALVPGLIASAQARESRMVAKSRQETGSNSAVAFEAVREEAMGCTRCHLYKFATRTVFGEGAISARLMLVGEQPGDQEDIAGQPFVGPAGQVLDRALADAGVDRATTYVTNAVKHFKFERRGKRRIHSKPNGPEIDACRWWIEQERLLIRPPVTVALGATAARSLIGKVVTISGTRGQPLKLDDGGECWVTIHPSYLLRLQDKADKEREYAQFVEDLRTANARVAALAAA
jgi:DNA polymerase